MLESLQKQMENHQNVLETLPTNNKENRQKCLDYIEKLKKATLDNLHVLRGEIQNRKAKLTQISSNPAIVSLENTLQQYDILPYCNAINTPYEKLELDQLVYEIGHFYNENLQKIQDNIFNCIQLFERVGVSLTVNDFTYSTFAQTYMKAIFEKDSVQEAFQTIYWKCPDLFLHIALNIRSIYLKNERKIDANLQKLCQERLLTLNLSQERALDGYVQAQEQLMVLKKEDKKIILDHVLDGSLSLKDYTDEALHKIYQKFNLQDMESSQAISLVQELYENVVEYQNFLHFSYVIEDIKKRWSEKNSSKKLVDSKKKEILKLEKEMQKFHKKMQELSAKQGGIMQNHRETKLGKISLDVNQKIIELKKLYEELDEAVIFEKLKSYLTEESTLYDCLLFASSFDHYMIRLLKQKGELQTMEEYLKEITELKKFVYSSANRILSNITILDERDIRVLILDRYRLLNISITEDMLESGNLDTIRLELQTLLDGNHFRNSGWKMEDLEFLNNISNLSLQD